ncbi:alkaline phosphatase D family protein [Streptomyces sp. NPDC002004]
MARLCLGPLLRYVDGSSATVWVEASRPCLAEVRCADGASGRARTFHVAGHHYALVPVAGLAPGTATAYEVRLDDVPVWPPRDGRFPASEIRTPAEHPDEVRVTFGSCRWAAPPIGGRDPVGPDALGALGTRLAADPAAERPDVLLLLGDQVYADETSEATRRWLDARRGGASGGPAGDDSVGGQVADYEEYTRLYRESWLTPEVRWLLSTVPSCMIFDDHDVIDDWNTSGSWVADMRATAWWHERVVSALMAYWVHQHLGNLSPADLAADPLYEVVCAAPDGTEALRAFVARADAEPASARWSYRRDFGRVRLVMVDTRAARVLEEGGRAMLHPAEAAWLSAQVRDGQGPPHAGEAPAAYDHLLLGTSLPWLLPPLIHDAEAWSAALCRGDRGPRWARFGERLRRAADLEHWAAFPASFEGLTALLAEAGSGAAAPATVCVLSGDVHHGYVAEPTRWDGRGPAARVLQLTCSPVHNAVPAVLRLAFRLGWSRAGQALGRRLAGHGRIGRTPVDWTRGGGPWFGNQLMTLTFGGRSARLRLDRARRRVAGSAELETVTERTVVP